jgi:hypothetical protein
MCFTKWRYCFFFFCLLSRDLILGSFPLILVETHDGKDPRRQRPMKGKAETHDGREETHKGRRRDPR